MRKTRPYVLGLAAALAATAATSSPTALPHATPAASHVSLSSSASALPVAFGAAAAGSMDRVALQQASARSAQAAAVAGVEGAGRSVVPIGDVNADGKADLVDLRADGGRLTVAGLSGHNGTALWTARWTQPGTIYGAAFPATIDADGADAYLLVQWEHEGLLTWQLLAVDGATGAERWSQAGVLPSGEPTIPPKTPPSPPTLPPRPNPNPTGLPTSVPTPTSLPTAAPVPSATPTAVPTETPSPVPSELPTPIPTETPTTLPSATPTPAPPAPMPTPTSTPAAAAAQSSPPTSTLPTNPPTIPSPLSTPGLPSGGSSGTQSAQQVLPGSIEAFTIGLAPVDVDGDHLTDIPLIAFEVATGPDGAAVTAATLVTLSAAGGLPAGVIAAGGRGAAPYVGIAGDMTGDGLPDLVASDEIVDATAGVAAVTYRAAAGNGRPLWAAADRVEAGSAAIYDARSDVTADGVADLVAHRLPVDGSGRKAMLAVRSGFGGLLAWSTELPEASVVTVGASLDDDEGADIVTQSVDGATADAIPAEVTYRALSGADGEEIYVERYAFPCGGCAGSWTATLTGDAGDLNADGAADPTHEIAAYPSTDAGASAQAGVDARTGEALWTLECACAPGTPVQASLDAGPGQDLIEAKEVVTKLTDSIALRAASGADASALWSTSVVIGGGADRIRSIALAPADLTGAGTADVLVTAIQRSGSIWRSVIVAVRGTTGRVIWIRTS